MLERTAILSRFFLIFQGLESFCGLGKSFLRIKSEKDKKNNRKGLTKYKLFDIIRNGKKEISFFWTVSGFFLKKKRVGFGT